MLRRIERLDRAEHLHLLVANRLGVGADRRLHREEADDLQQVVLHDVADRARLLVELAAARDAEALGHRDLHAAHVVAVPDRLEERVAEAEEQQVLHRFLAQVVIDAEDRGLVEDAVQGAVQLARGREVAAERLLEDDPRAARAARLRQPLDDGSGRGSAESRDSEWGAARRRAPASAGRTSPGRSSRPRRSAAATTSFANAAASTPPPCSRHARARPLAELLQAPARARDADHRHVEVAAADHRLERGEDLLVGEVARRAEEDERIGASRFHPTVPSRARSRRETRCRCCRAGCSRGSDFMCRALPPPSTTYSTCERRGRASPPRRAPPRASASCPAARARAGRRSPRSSCRDGTAGARAPSAASTPSTIIAEPSPVPRPRNSMRPPR